MSRPRVAAGGAGPHSVSDALTLSGLTIAVAVHSTVILIEVYYTVHIGTVHHAQFGCTLPDPLQYLIVRTLCDPVVLIDTALWLLWRVRDDILWK